jgi:hypothetical protein
MLQRPQVEAHFNAFSRFSALFRWQIPLGTRLAQLKLSEIKFEKIGIFKFKKFYFLLLKRFLLRFLQISSFMTFLFEKF